MKYIRYLDDDVQPNYKKITKLLSKHLKPSNIDWESEDEKFNHKSGSNDVKSVSPCYKNGFKMISVSFNEKAKSKLKQNSNILSVKEHSKER